MVIVRLWGGLGNQFFQYACGYALAKKRNEELFLDTRFYTEGFLKRNPRFSKQQLNILLFNIKYKQQLNLNNEFKKINFMQNKYFSRFIRFFKNFSIKADDNITYIKETRLVYLPNIFENKSPNLYLDGYWQSEMYFKDVESEIREQFYLENENVNLISERYHLTNTNSVSIHVRLGDYKKRKNRFTHSNTILDVKYYQEAINTISKKLTNPVFYIFSNDLMTAKSLLGKQENFVFISEEQKLNDIEEFLLMSKCSNHIISNSTFSWWSAWLSNNKNGLVLVPNLFFGNKDIIPSDWIKIEVE